MINSLVIHSHVCEKIGYSLNYSFLKTELKSFILNPTLIKDVNKQYKHTTNLTVVVLF